MEYADTDPAGRFGWFCLRTQPRREHAAALALHRRVGVAVFAPRIERSATPAAAPARRVAEALFPGYLFARFHYPQQVRHVISTTGVNGVVRFGGEPPAIADGVIEFLRAQVRAASAADPAPLFPAGAWVKIASGCFRELEGRVLADGGPGERVRVLLSLLGREIQVSVPAHQLVPAGAGAPRYPAGLLTSSRAGAPVA